jgi:ATP-dependent exoDNAse (exonuclease V) beta subunit
VILPFLGRDVRPPSPRYPTLLKIPGEREPLAALNKDDFQEDNRAIVKLANQQEAARLLYVAATRARHTLVLVDDGEIFLNTKNSLPTNAQLRHFGEKQAAIFANISTEAEFCDATARAKSHRAESETAIEMPALEKREREKALARAKSFIRKINPSAYEPEVDLETVAPRGISLHSPADNFATLHGRWWHAFFQQVNWREKLTDIDLFFEKFSEQAPDRARVAKEWKRVRENLFAGEMAKRFGASSAQTRTEFPFSWNIDRKRVLEGVIDFLVISEKEKRCLLIDWKTNNISPGDAEVLRVRYRPQLAAYWKAVGKITQLEVTAGLFSTGLGRLLLYESEELESEWKRLEQLPAERVAEETSLA